MGRQKEGEESIRKLQRTGKDKQTYAVTLPKELIAELGWQKKQKVVVKRKGKTLVVEDWKG